MMAMGEIFLMWQQTRPPFLPSMSALLRAGQKGRVVSEGRASMACLSSLQIKNLQQSQLAIKSNHLSRAPKITDAIYCMDLPSRTPAGYYIQ